MTWNEVGGTVSQAFNAWRHTDAENLAYLRLSAEWSSAAYDRTCKEAEESANAVFDPDRHYGDEHADMFDDAVDGLWPSSYAWMTEASVLKAGVTAFEVYLEQALQEVLDQYQVTVDGQRAQAPPGHERLRVTELGNPRQSPRSTQERGEHCRGEVGQGTTAPAHPPERRAAHARLSAEVPGR
ncbi:hypothetical protein [Streptomyces sp. NBC_00690]|uniref:hypothetical protein n=1 Tax=Streptomyces sp. NBC_00690 TaxID=2975808 RepID=UPI002E2C9EA5|nr:hypothetical protein [Streptomyces sp. NBC_00690]